MALDSDFGVVDFSPYQIHSRREIIALLHALQERNQLVSLLINGGAEAVVTSILHVDEEQNKVIVDSAPSNLLNERITQSDNISFETFLDSIRILFFATRIERCIYDHLPALRLALPPYMIRLQRREFYRVATPVANPVRCLVPVATQENPQAAPVSTYLQNISAGGVALVDEKKALDNTIGKVFKNCRIDLPGGNAVTTSLQVQNTHELTFANGRSIRRLGC